MMALKRAVAVAKAVGAWWFPPLCTFCSQPCIAIPICDGCRRDYLPRVARCRLCAIRLPGSKPDAITAHHCHGASQRSLCRRCSAKGYPSVTSHCLGDYRWPLANLITLGKYHGQRSVLFALGELLAERIIAESESTNEPRPTLVIPVPLHSRRLRTRGFNQARDIARAAAARLNLSVTRENDLIQRSRDTASQTALSVPARLRNVANAFQLTEGAHIPDHVAIVDDVMTSGSTMAAVARVCRAGGASKVEFWMLARACMARSMT